MAGQPERSGGRRPRSGRRPMPNGRINRMFVFEPIHDDLLEAYRRRNNLANDSQAIRHLIERSAELA